MLLPPGRARRLAAASRQPKACGCMAATRSKRRWPIHGGAATACSPPPRPLPGSEPPPSAPGSRSSVVEREAIDRLFGEGTVHQGLALSVAPLPRFDLRRSCAPEPGRNVVLVLDQINDPHNLGAILRSAAAFDARAVVLPERRSAELGGVVAKAASGALDLVPVVEVVNLARALEELADWATGGSPSTPRRRQRRRRAGGGQPRAGARRRGQRPAPPRARALRRRGAPADRAADGKPQRLGRGRHRALRAGAVARVRMTTSTPEFRHHRRRSPTSRLTHPSVGSAAWPSARSGRPPRPARSARRPRRRPRARCRSGSPSAALLARGQLLRHRPRARR